MPPSLSDLFPAGPTIHLLAGSPHAGKSTLAAQLSKAALDGEEWLGFTPFTQRIEQVTYIMVDRPVVDNRRALERVGLLDRVTVVELVSAEPWRKALMHAHIVRRKGAFYAPEASSFATCILPHIKPHHLTFIDTLGPQLLGDIHRDTVVGNNLTEIQTLLRGHNDSVIVGLSYGVKLKADYKANYASPIDNIIGSSIMRGKLSTMAYLSSVSMLGPQFLYIAPRATEHQRVQLGWHDGLLVRDDGQVELIDMETSPLTVKEKWVLEQIGEGAEFTTGELAERLEMDKGHLSRILKRLAITGLLLMVGYGKWRRGGES